ncbi:T9SS type A sorting domain-containing protein [Winogradskyella bathintestinalis]|uniref:T9SS type A sorting domain-containing protein n=1 Tax=Winogradskyella bathintestinalis TaxID=3035208 RepID=A0ABT7ZTG5_9FLAO|nr:T9SS type A sorting domain-containing protein [Winogradskyella bathintestinalis]MDN3492291.1 T9SS type A sorting domain-containing protein [Winogradskyella bathintestinalis]
MKKTVLSLITLLSVGALFAFSATPQNESIEDILNPYSETSKWMDGSSFEIEYKLFQDENFKISPNPSKNKLNIKLPRSSENMTLEVFDVLGKRIHKSVITKLEASVDVSGWKTGVYLVKVSDENNSQTKRFIKQ